LKQDTRQLELVNACKRGDRRAQHQLYTQYAKAMYNICLRMVRNEADAEDLLQNAFIDVFTKIDSYRFESTIGAWIKRIVINTCINFFKKRRLDTQEWDERIADQPMKESESEYEDRELSVKRIQSAMEQLPAGYRTVFSLYLLEGYDHKEIAQVLDISEATSKSQYSRAKRKMRQLISEME
jgi:RNA polymerase sigma factor (sigma-70 family)